MTTEWTRPVNESSTIANAATVDNDLLITFNSGRIYKYANAAGEFNALINADSAGKYFNANIKNGYLATEV